jgi:processive 1,2-diacylglycerol beta-glucosyltransferase/1,2-diacylglycerol 3-beta-galactosyltransferase
MEALYLRKPLVLSTYIHGQELGNVHQVVQSGAGTFLQSPRAIYRHLHTLATNQALYQGMIDRINGLAPSADLAGITDYLLSPAAAP